MRALLTWGCIAVPLSLLVVAYDAPAVHAQSGCAVTGEREFAFPESKPVQLGGEVDVAVSLSLDCPGGTWPDSLSLTEGLTPELALVEGVGTQPSSISGGRTTWMVDKLPPRGRPLNVAYSLYVLPDPARFSVTRTLEIDWPMEIEISIGGNDEPLEPPLVDPLVVAERPGARDCRRIRHDHKVDPGEVLPGEPFDVELSVAFDACYAKDPRHRAMVAVQPPPDFPTHYRMTLAVASLLASIDGHQAGARGMSGLYANSPTPAVAIGPTVDRDRTTTALPKVPSGPSAGADAAAALEGALSLLSDWPDHHELIYYLTDGAAPLSDPDETRAALSEAAAQDVEVVAVCIGGGCDPALQYPHEFADWDALAGEADELPEAHGGEPMEVRGVRLVEGVPSYLTVHDGTTMPAPSDNAPGAMTWENLSAEVGEELSFRYQAHIQDWGRFPVGSSGELSYERLDGRGLDTDLLMPGFVSVEPDPDADGCRSEVDKTARPARVPVGEPVTVQLELSADCQQIHDRMHVVLAMDRSGSMTHGGAEYSYIKMAARALAEMLAVDAAGERRFGLVSHGIAPAIDVPLTNDLDDIIARIDAMAGKGQDNVPLSIEMALQMLRDARPATGDVPLEVIVVLSDGGQDFPAADVIAAADAAKADGVVIVSACSLTNNNECDVMSTIAGDQQYYYEVDRIEQILERFVRLGMQLRQIPLEHVLITDDLPAHVRLVPGSAHPPVTRIEGQRLIWEIDDVTEIGARPTYDVRPLLLGRQPTNTWADVSFRDERGRTGYRVFPVPEVETYLPGPRGPCEVVVDKTAAPAESRVGDEITAGLTIRADCPRKEAPVDAVLVIDHSESMRGGDRLGSAVEAALAFANALEPARDRLGLVTFSTTVDNRVALNHDFDRVREQLYWLDPEGTTAIGAAMRAAAQIMGARRTDAKALVVLLTDGRDPQPWIMLEQARDLKAAGVTIATFCAGDCDPELEAVASRPELAVTVDDPEMLAELYRTLAEDFAGGFAHNVVVSEWLPPILEPVAGSFSPAASELDSDLGDIVWRPGPLRDDTVAMSYRVRPTTAGRLPIGRARLDYLYGEGTLLSGSVYFPVPYVDVAGGVPATPTPALTPTFTPTVVSTRTPTPDLTREPPPLAFELFVPLAGRGRDQSTRGARPGLANSRGMPGSRQFSSPTAPYVMSRRNSRAPSTPPIHHNRQQQIHRAPA